jgi:hypothetical protein
VHPETQHLNTVEVAQVAQALLAVLVAADIQVFSLALAQVLHSSLQVPVVVQALTTVLQQLVQPEVAVEPVTAAQQQTLHHQVALAQQRLVVQLQQTKVLHAFPRQVLLCKAEMVAV